MANKGRKFNLNGKTLTMPLAAFTMAAILFVYTRTSIRQAKLNAQKHREADGGQINWRNESLRRHGVMEKPVQGGDVKQLVGGLVGGEEVRRKGGEGGKDGADGAGGMVKASGEEQRIREVVARRGRPAGS